MKNNTSSILVAVSIASTFLGGCGAGGGAVKPANSGPSQGTLGLDNLTPEQQIAKVQNDPQIPEQYKQTYINSIKSKAKGGAPR